jgi:formylglycine-generating enzyme required for sulfatase activity
LRAIPPDERDKRRPLFSLTQNTVELAYQAGAFTLAIRPTGGDLMRAAEREPLVYPERSIRTHVRWERMPVSGISYLDGQAYAAWLAETGKVPGARLCTTFEWERAARGADLRAFPHGDQLAASDANIDETYDRRSLGFGPDEVGSFLRSDSPFGVADLAGNVWEFTAGPDGRPWVKGGCYYLQRVNAMIANNSPTELRQRGARYGLRICADSARSR